MSARSRPAHPAPAVRRLGRPPPPQRSGVPTHGRRDRSRAVRSVTWARVLIAALLAASPLTAQQLAFTPYHANGTYAVRERIGWHVSVVPGQSGAGTYTYTVKRDGLSVIARGTLDLKTGRATIETSLERPGMVLVEVRPAAGTPETGFHGASKSEVGRVLLGAAVAPLEIRSSGPPPPDFDAFWATQLRRLDSVPPEPVLTPRASGRADVEYFTIQMKNVDGAHIYGQLARPAEPERGPLPAGHGAHRERPRGLRFPGPAERSRRTIPELGCRAAGRTANGRLLRRFQLRSTDPGARAGIDGLHR